MTKDKQHPAAVVIFGGQGDLSKRKLLPAFYNLFIEQHLPSQFLICCVDFLQTDREAFEAATLAGINSFSRNGQAKPEQWEQFAQHLEYVQGDFLAKETYAQLKTRLKSFDEASGQAATRLFYLAIAPRFIEPISESLYTNKLCNKVALHRIVVEKPFGTDLASARKLNKFLQERFDEKQVYRIDHYLGKETVQNIMAFRFANYVFEPLWNNRYIDHVQISVAESVAVGSRGGYYDASGALRDMIQNHLLQLLCIVAMECPGAYKAEQIRDAKNNVLKRVRPFTPETVFKQVIRGQYTEGTVQGAERVGYHQEAQVAADSSTETYVAAQLFIDNPRWKGVPFFLRTGKSLPRQSSVIVIEFKDSPHKIFRDDIVPNRLVISLQPELEISLLFESKVPGLEMKLRPVEMDFTYQDHYTESLPEAYETLLLDALHGDATLFMRADQVETAWKVVMPILDAWKKYPTKKLEQYHSGSWGPAAADKLLKSYAKDWMALPEVRTPVKEKPAQPLKNGHTG